MSSFATDLQYSPSSHFHQYDSQWILLPTSFPIIQLCKSISSALWFPWGKNCTNLSIFFPPVLSHSASPLLYGQAESMGRSSSLGSDFSGGVWVSHLLYPVQQGAAQPWGLHLTYPRTLSVTVMPQLHFRKGSQAGSLNHPAEPAGPSVQSRRLLSFARPQPGWAGGSRDPSQGTERAQHGSAEPWHFAFSPYRVACSG